MIYLTGTHFGKAQQSSPPRCFLSLPLELRRVIYRHMLIPSPVVNIKRKAYHIEPAILLVNKDIYKEASRILYQENNWVMLCINAPFRTFLGGWHLEDTVQRYPIVPLAESSFAQNPCLELDIRKMGEEVGGMARRELRRFIVSLDGLPRVCQILTAAKRPSNLEIVANFFEVKANTLDKILDCLEEACGYGSVVVKGLDAAATQQAITKLMMPETSTGEEALERAFKYQARIVERIAQGRYTQAMKACQDGMAYFEFHCASVVNRRFNYQIIPHPIFEIFADFALKHARCCLVCGDHQSARQILNLFISSDSASLYRRTISSTSEAHFYYGQSMVAVGAENAAAFSFFRALALVPHHEGANVELDAMEARLALRGSDVETAWARQILQSLSTWRHRSVRDGRLPDAELSKLLSDFLLSGEEFVPLTTQRGSIVDDDVSFVPKSRLTFWQIH